MQNYWHDLKPGPNVPDTIHTVVEIPKGSRNKYEFDKRIGAFKLDRVLYSALQYDPFFSSFDAYTDLPPHYLREVEHFFTVYKDLEGTRVEPIGWEHVDVARQHILYAINAYWDMRAGRAIKRT